MKKRTDIGGYTKTKSTRRMGKSTVNNFLQVFQHIDVTPENLMNIQRNFFPDNFGATIANAAFLVFSKTATRHSNVCVLTVPQKQLLEIKEEADWKSQK